VSGGGHLPYLAIDRAVWARSGPIKTYETAADPGSRLVFFFCADCGSPLLKTTTRAPALVFVHPGALDDLSINASGQDVFEAARQPCDVQSVSRET